MDSKEPDFLDEYTNAEDTAEQAAEPVAVEKVEQEQPETPAPVATTAADTHSEERVPLAALMAERDKRKERDQRIAQYERELAELRQRTQQPETSFFEAPEQHIQHHLRMVEQQANQRLIAALEAQAREQFPDYDEVFADLEAEAANNPVLVNQVLSAPNPALAAYKLGKQLREVRQMKDPEAYRKQVEAEVRSSIEAEYRAKEAARVRTAEAIPPDLTASRSAKGEFAPAAETVFDSIFKS